MAWAASLSPRPERLMRTVDPAGTERPGRKPKLAGRKTGSRTGSSTCLSAATCYAVGSDWKHSTSGASSRRPNCLSGHISNGPVTTESAGSRAAFSLAFGFPKSTRASGPAAPRSSIDWARSI